MPIVSRRPAARSSPLVVGEAMAAGVAAANRASRGASITLGLTLPTDTVLYLLLPLYPDAFGVTLAEAGLLLAANRLVRIVGYGWVAGAYERRGPRASCIAAVIGAAVSSLGYALAPAGLLGLLLARLVWGLSFAAMNIAVQALPTSEREGMASRSGRSRAVIAAGPMLGLIAGAALSTVVGPRAVFSILAGVALLGLPFAAGLPGGRGQAVRGGTRFGIPSRLDAWSFVQGVALDGLFILGLAVLARQTLPEEAAIAAGAAMALRYGAEILLGPPGGMLAERFDIVRVLVLLSCGSAIGLAAIGLGALWSGVIAVVLLRGLIQPLPALVAAEANPGPGRVRALARLATWRDLGAGIGPLVAGALLPVVAPSVLYGITAALLAGTALAMRGQSGRRRSGTGRP